MSVSTSPLELAVSDGGKMRAHVARPEGSGPFPGLIVFQEAFGVTAHIRDVANRFAAEGYLAVAPELFHRTAPPGFEGSTADFRSVQPHLQAVTEATLEADIQSVWDWLASRPEVRPGAIACVGYCLGGRASFVANAILPFKAAISYYGGRIAPVLVKRAPELQAPMLFFWGGLDQHIPPEQVAVVTSELRKAGKPHTSVEFSYADHGFFRDGTPTYNEEAARESWALALAFLREKLAR
jgi:carboxymethylenebutenolidase